MIKLLLATVLAAVTAPAMPQEVGQTLFRDIRYGESEEEIATRHPLEKGQPTEPTIITPTCKSRVVIIWEGKRKEGRRVAAIRLNPECPDDVLALLTEKYGQPTVGTPQDYYRQDPAEALAGSLGAIFGGRRGQQRYRVNQNLNTFRQPNAVKTRYLWRHEGITVTLETDIGNERHIRGDSAVVTYRPAAANSEL